MAAVLIAAACTLSGCAERTGHSPTRSQPLLSGATVDSLTGEYSGVNSIAEFHDSLLVVADAREGILWRINLRRGTRDSLGRRGDGPGEHRRVGSIAKVHRDSVAMFDGFAGWPFVVLNVASGRGRTARVLEFGRHDDIEASLWVTATPLLRAGDTLGHVYGAPEMAPPAFDSATKRVQLAKPLDEWSVVRYSVDGAVVDTPLVFARGHTMATSGPDAAGRWIRRLDQGPFAPLNGWAVRDDGSILRADAGKYVLSMHAANGDSLRSWRIPFEPLPLSDSSWEAHLARARTFAQRLTVGQVRSIGDAIGRPMRPPPEVDFVEPEKPKEAPPLAFATAGAALHFVDELAWVPVHLDDTGAHVGWDVVDLRSGTRRARYVLPDGYRLLLVTRRGVYVAAKDEDDLQRILFLRPATLPPVTR